MRFEDKYSIKISDVPNKPGEWHSMLVEIFEKRPDILDDNRPDGAALVKIGEYTRNYYCLYNTFLPFRQGDKEYALYSTDYRATRVMRLPSCEDICGEEGDSFGFCPVDFHVPYKPERAINGLFGFVAGCIWGDDSSRKVQYLDLSKIDEGILKREERFGYVHLPCDKGNLAEAINIDDLFGFDLQAELFNDRLMEVATTKWFQNDTIFWENVKRIEAEEEAREKELEEQGDVLVDRV